MAHNLHYMHYTIWVGLGLGVTGVFFFNFSLDFDPPLNSFPGHLPQWPIIIKKSPKQVWKAFEIFWLETTREWSIAQDDELCLWKGLGMKNNPQTTHPEILKCTVLRRNGLSVFHLSPCRRLNISFESGAKKALRQWIHQTEVKRHLQILVIKSYPEATKPTSPSKILHHPHKPHPPHTPIFPIFPQYPEELGARGKKQSPVHAQWGCYCTWQSSGRRDRNPKDRCRGWDVLWAALQGALTCLSNPGAIPEPRAPGERWIHERFEGPSRGREQQLGEGWLSRATYCLAMLLPALSNWLSQRIGGNFTN